MNLRRVTVVGAGVVGLCVALRLQQDGARVLLVDEGSDTPNASEVAAGMIAPASEAAFGEPLGGRFPMLRAARDLWLETPAAGRLDRCGSLTLPGVDKVGSLAEAAEAFQREGVPFRRLTDAEARECATEIERGHRGAVFTAEDWRLDAPVALGDLRRAFLDGGGAVRRYRVNASPRSDEADALVVCAGWGSRSLDALAPELQLLSPIKGQLLRFPGAPPFVGPILRHGSVYLVPSGAGVIVGASMEAGADDLAPSPSVAAELACAARALLPHLNQTEPVSAVGVRAATPDGLPLVGRSRSGVHLATGFRRNGWLLAPLAARIVADQLAGRDPGAWASALRPDRFGPSSS